ncbi:MAG: beta-Ala-His dipeptidase [Betaproteobacteria bacterium]|nr:beta-Ala-His dipeptidase [Betaproteobacteria bacterium]
MPLEKDAAYVLNAFAALAAIPRPSKQEKAASDYLKHWAQAHGLSVIQDASNNVIMEKEASPGCEHAPLTILQAHMDMICVRDENITGTEYDPAKHPVRLRKNPQTNTLSAEGTSLGADDGIGVAMIQYLFQAKKLRHGPLRAIITTDEEAGMSGASNLDAVHLNAVYLINLDWEVYGSLCNSSADITVYRFRRLLSMRPPRLNSAYQLVVSGLTGGHSGINIHMGRANALCMAAHILTTLRRMGVGFELANFEGGTASNAIPARADALVCLDSAQAKRAVSIAEEAVEKFEAAYKEREQNALVKFFPCPTPQYILSGADTDALLDLITATRSGIHSIRHPPGGIVESSSNLGLIRIENRDRATAEIAARSSVQWHSEEMRHSFETLAVLTGFDLDVPSASPAWPMRPDSRLAEYACTAFKELTGRSMTVEPVHAGLECGIFAHKNPKLDMISIGPRIDNAHSTSETLYLDGLPNTLRCIIKTLEKITEYYDSGC